MKRQTALILSLGIGLASMGVARAGEIVYTPINPSFGGNPNNTSHLMGTANAQNQPKRKADEARQAEARAAAAARAAASGTDRSDRFLQLLEAHLYSGLAQRVSEAVFNDNGPTTGTIRFNDQQVTFVRSTSEIRLSILDSTTGQVTEIVVPTFVTQ
jgi:curli production assembly/transport component CsgF